MPALMPGPCACRANSGLLSAVLAARTCCDVFAENRPGPRRGAGLLADAELAEDLAEQVVGAERAGDLGQRIVRRAQFFGEQFQRAVAHRGVFARGLQVGGAALQGLHMALAGDEHALGAGLPGTAAGAAAASADTAAWPAPGADAELLESGVRPVDILAHAQDYGTWAQSNLAQLNQLLDLQEKESR